MNIFVLDRDPALAARYLCDKHIPKMALESAQLMCSAIRFHRPDVDLPYRSTHVNHPCSVWSRASLDNFMWLAEHAIAICDEYRSRYGKRHASESVIWQALDEVLRTRFPRPVDMTPFAQAMPERYRSVDAVEAYRKYYKGEKQRFATWNRSSEPDWWRK